jgi:hypothetical protein
LAIVQISRITQRKGLQENLPQLAGAEFGWSIDERRLYIGNGTLEDGAPVIGNTEILTEFSDVLSVLPNYTYRGEAAGYTVQTGPSAGDSVALTLQTWLDQWCTITDFGGVGDGVTDNTDAINRALFEIYCRSTNPAIRRGIFFPAGVYMVTGTILVPPYAYLYGEGINSSIIRMAAANSTVDPYVVRTADSLQQTGANIGLNGATAPRDITIAAMAFESLDPTLNIMLAQNMANLQCTQVRLVGPLTQVELTGAADDTAGVRIASTVGSVCNDLSFDQCYFGGTTWAVNTDQQVQGALVQNSKLDTLYQGVVLGTGTVINGGATGFRLLNNLFDNIFAEGVLIGQVSLNSTAHNIFYDVGNHFNGVANPASAIVSFESGNNVSISDMFARSDANATVYPRVNLNDQPSIATTNGSKLALGTYIRQSGSVATVVNATVAPGTAIFTVSTTAIRAFAMRYTIVRDTTVRTGTFVLSSDASGSVTFADDFVENSATGVTLSATQSGTVITVRYTADPALGIDGNIKYSLAYLA